MKNKSSLPALTTGEKVFGWVYAFTHIFGLPVFVDFVYAAFDRYGAPLPERFANLIYYGIGFFLILAFMTRYLKKNFYNLCDNPFTAIRVLLEGYIFYYFLVFCVSIIINAVSENVVNPNNDSVIAEFLKNKNLMLAVAAIMAPIVEEILFRGVMFGTIQGKNRLVAYVVSTAFFAIYHLWNYFKIDYSPALFLDLLEYVPGGIVLAWAYEKSKSIWVSILLHMMVNIVAITISVQLLG